MSTLLSTFQRHYAALETGDMDATIDIFADDVVTETPTGTLRGKDEFLALGETFKVAMSDMRHEVQRSWEVGDTVIIEAVFSGRHTGPMRTPDGEIPPSGNTVTFPFADFAQFRDGVCVSHRIYWDNVALMAQLGAMA